MRCYPEYKESGVEFIGKIPKAWHLTKLKYVSQIDNSGLWGEEQGLLDIDASVSTTAHLTRDGDWLIEEMPTRSFSKTDYEYYSGKNGDIIIVKSSGSATNIITGKAGFIDHLSKGMVFSNFLMRVKPNREKYEPKLSYYFLISSITKERIKRMVSTTTYPNLKVEEYISNLIPIPSSKDEQVKIVNFLDRKTGQIDELLRIKGRRIELLQEQRTALINQAVTKGLDPNVEMKPSGVEWIGEIPKNWIISKVKHEFESLDNLRIPLNAETRGSMELKIYDYYGASGVIDKVESYIFDEPLILIGEDGANLYLRSTPLAFKATGKYWVNNHAHVLRPKHGNMDYLTNMLESLDYIHYITGAAQPKLTSENLMNITVIIPPPPEQVQIANFLDHKTQHIDELISTEQRKIELLKEYRQSLISEVVTGKIDVRNEV